MKNYIYQFLTFFGTVIHEFSHYIACVISRVNVEEVKFFQLSGDYKGYVLHEVPKSYTKRILISTAPFLVNNLISVLLLYYFFSYSIYSIILVVVCFSLSFMSFPSKQDAKLLYPKRWLDYINPVFWISIPIVLLILLGDYLRKYYFNYFFAICLILCLTVFEEKFSEVVLVYPGRLYLYIIGILHIL